MRTINNVSSGDLPTRTSSQWVMVLSKEGSYPLYFLMSTWTIRVCSSFGTKAVNQSMYSFC